MAESYLMDVEGVAKYLSLAEVTVYRWVATNTIPHIRLGKAIRFAKADIDRWIETKKEQKKYEPSKHK